MADIHSVTAEIRRGKKRKKKKGTGQKYLLCRWPLSVNPVVSYW